MGLSTLEKIEKDIVNAIDQKMNGGTTPYDTEAEVIRIDGDTAWVHIPGGVTETPVALTINAQKGDKVQVRVSNEGAWLMGNATAPPTDDTKANEADKKAAEAKYIAVDAVDAALKADTAAQDAVNSADIARGAAQDAQTAASNAQTAAGNAVTAAGNALTAAQNAQVSADAALVSLSNVEDVVGVLDWITAHGTMTANGSTALDPSKVYFVRDNNGDYHVGSYYYSIVAEPKAEDRTNYYTLSINESVQNYVATHVVVDTEGLWLIPDSGGNKVLIATGAGSSYTTAGTYIIGKVNGVDTVFAKFTTDGATMNATNSTQIAHLGYGEGNSESGTATAPYYALGEFRTHYIDNYSSSSTYAKGDLCSYGGNTYVCKTAITTPEAWNANHWSKSIGNYSTIEGTQLIASGDSSHAEGRYTEAAGHYSHAEGGPIGAPMPGPRAIGMCSHAEGGGFVFARGACAHAEGRYTEANGLASHAQNDGTIAQGAYQTALGQYNVADTTSAVIIGNGTADNARSNALTVDWNGNVNIPSGANYCINNVPISGGGGGGDVTGVKGNAESTYRTGNVNLTPANIGAVPTTRTVNGKSLSSDITLSASDIGAQEILVSGTNIKTVNGNSLLGSGDIDISASVYTGTSSTAADNANKVVTGNPTFVHATGNLIAISFTNANTVEGQLAFAIDSTIYHPVYVNRTVTSATNTLLWDAGQTVLFQCRLQGPQYVYDFITKVDSSIVMDVQVNGASVVGSGIATIPKASLNDFGVIKMFANNDPPAGYIRFVYNESNSDFAVYTPLIPYDLNTQTFGTIRAKFLPDATTAEKGAMSASDKTKLDGIASGAEVNVNADWNSSSGDSKILNKPTLGTASAKDALSSISADSNDVPTVTAVKNYVASAVTGAVAFQGTVNSTFAPTDYVAGYYWVVGTAGTYAGQVCEAGDMIFCINDYSSAYSASDFDVVQTNLDITSITNGEIDTIVAS